MIRFAFERSTAVSPAVGAVLLASLVLCGAGCSTDENPNRTCQKDDECPSNNCDRGFCIDGDGNTKDAGKPPKGDGGHSDAALDAGDAALDAGDAALDGGDAEVDSGPADPGEPYEDVDVGKPCDRATANLLCFYAPREISADILNVGECRAGVHRCNCPEGEPDCKQGTWGACNAVYPTPESCNGRDDDCDAESDEEVGSDSCEVPGQMGACREGMGSCAQGLVVCNQTVEAEPEKCDGSDNDCDGDIDEDTDRACYPEGMEGCSYDATEDRFTCKGLCATGMQMCVGGQPAACMGAIVPSDEVCTNAGDRTADENCDGVIDESSVCSCTDGQNFPCYEGPTGTLSSGVCLAGTQTCNGTVLSACMNQRLPQDETCANEGVDDDCDGDVDDVPRRDEPCTVSSNKGLCRPGTRQCRTGALVCVTPQPVDEVCNALDDDCDGAIDNGFDLQADENNCGACGMRCAGGETCCAGRCVNMATDANHCGSCTNRCGPGNECCTSQCKNVLSDNTNCLKCGVRCPGLLLGVLGTCCSGSCSTSLGCGG